MASRHTIRLAIGLWLTLVAVCCIRPVFKPFSNTVFPIYAYAGVDFAAGLPLYAKTHPNVDVFRYSPPVAAFFQPFRHLPMGVAGACWIALGAGIYLTGLAAWAASVCPQVARSHLFLLALPLTVGSLSNGQANVHILGLMLWATVLAIRGQWAIAAPLIAAVALFKGYPLALGLLFALLAPLRHGVTLVVALIAGGCLPLLFQNAEYVESQYQQWIRSVASDDRTAMPLASGLQDASMLVRVLGGQISLAEFRIVQLASGAVAAGVIGFLLWRRLPTDRVAVHAFTLGLCWMATFGPCVESSTFILLAPIVSRELLDSHGRTRWQLMLTITGGLLFLVSVVVFAFPHTFHRPIIALGIQPIAALLVTCGAAGRIFGDRPANRATPEQTVIETSPLLRAA